MGDEIQVYCYDDSINGQMVIGVRGYSSEIRIPKWDFIRCEDAFRVKNGRSWTDAEAIQFALKWAEMESQYIPFEEVSPKQKLLRE
ncbi:MAG TPA: hypothetical protein VK658_14715 [Chryseolinea sp.]|nr:hypothetical protein [Chryseolinea sp.]